MLSPPYCHLWNTSGFLPYKWNVFKPYSKEVVIKISQNNILMIFIWDSLHHLTLIAHSSLSSELFNSDPFRWVKLCFPQKLFFRLYNGKNQQALYVENLSFDKSPAWNIQSSFHRGWFYLYQGKKEMQHNYYTDYCFQLICSKKHGNSSVELIKKAKPRYKWNREFLLIENKCGLFLYFFLNIWVLAALSDSTISTKNTEIIIKNETTIKIPKISLNWPLDASVNEKKITIDSLSCCSLWVYILCFSEMLYCIPW